MSRLPEKRARPDVVPNNMKQVGLGLHNYHSAFNKFTYSAARLSIDHSPETAFCQNHVRTTALALGLAFTEQQSLFELVTLSMSTGSVLVIRDKVRSGGPLRRAKQQPMILS